MEDDSGGKMEVAGFTGFTSSSKTNLTNPNLLHGLFQ